MLTPLDIHNKEFRKGFRGYDEKEVDEFLDQVVRDYDTLSKENANLKEQLQTMSIKLEQYRRLEETLQNTLVVAQETAEDLKNTARREADLLVREARHEAERIAAVGEQRIRALREQYETLQREFRQYRARLRGLLVSQLDLLDQDWEQLPSPPPGEPEDGAEDDGAGDVPGSGEGDA